MNLQVPKQSPAGRLFATPAETDAPATLPEEHASLTPHSLQATITMKQETPRSAVENASEVLAAGVQDITDTLVEDFGPDHLTFDLSDPGGISTSFLAKVPGPRMRLGQARMEFSPKQTFGSSEVLQPYERLMYDAMTGDRTLFTDASGIEQLWNASQPLLDDPPPLKRYAPGTWGPDAMHHLIAPRRWRLPTL